MAENTTEKYSSLLERDIEELSAIYDDYLYATRMHELLLQQKYVDELSLEQVKLMYPERPDRRDFVIPWLIERLDSREKQEFTDFAANNIKGNGQATYVSLQHIRETENSVKAPVFAIEPYTNITMTMQLPSMIEKYTMSYTKEATLGNTVFYVDGRYKAVYCGDKMRDTPMMDCLSNSDLVTEITLMLNLGEAYRQNNYKNDAGFGRLAVNVYAAERIAVNENDILEILGCFTEKIAKICHQKYNMNKSEDEIKAAVKEGFLHLPADFEEYIDIRNLMRHQWDTLEDLDDFSLEKSKENKRVRANRVASYLKLCDKSPYKRMVSYVDVLHQMQQIMAEVYPNRLIKSPAETNTKFMGRVKAAYQQNPNKVLEVEINQPLINPKSWALEKNLRKVFRNVKILDGYSESESRFGRLDEYQKRSVFLRNFHDITSFAMGHCQRRGESKSVRATWKYLEKSGLITREECQKWQKYTDFRNELAHDFFDANLAKRLTEIEGEYYSDLKSLQNRICHAGPDVTKLENGVYEYTHKDGEVITLDYKDHTIYHQSKTSDKPLPKAAEEKNKKSRKETYPGGIELNIKNGDIAGIKLPSGVYVDVQKQVIRFDSKTHWYTNAEHCNFLKTPLSKVQTDKNLHLTGYFVQNVAQPFEGGNNLLIDEKHSLLLDEACHIKEFRFQNAENNMIKAEFKHTADGQNMILFADGTSILFAKQKAEVLHHNKALSYVTREEFAQTYEEQLWAEQVMKSRNGR